MNTCPKRSTRSVTGRIASVHASAATPQLLPEGITQARRSTPTANQELACRTSSESKLGSAISRSLQLRTVRSRCSRVKSSIAAKRKTMNSSEGLPGRYEMFVRMATPAGTSASQTFCQRKTAHAATYATTKTTNTISSTKGSGSLETPPVTRAVTQSPIRAQSSDQRATMPVPASGSPSTMVCMTMPTTIADPIASPAGKSTHAEKRIRVKAVPTTTPNAVATSSDGISSTQFARAIESANASWMTASSTKLSQSSHVCSRPV